MALEVLAALGLALLVLWLVFHPLLLPPREDLAALEPEAPEETRRGIALLALKEIEFDRETGKLSQRDYELLKARYGAEALAALDAEPQAGGGAATAPAQADTGDPEQLVAAHLKSLRSARSSGQPVPPAASLSCRNCGPRPESDAAFCSSCGLPLTAATFCTECGARLPSGSRFCAACGRKVAA
jgi:hypothetical protein